MTVDEFIAKWQVSGGNERANTQLFVTDLCALLGVDQPQPTQSDMGRNDYVFERHVVKTEIDGATSNGWIDLYKRECFTVRDFRGAMQGRADKGLIITTGTFTADARKEATRDGAPAIDLIDGDALCQLLKDKRLGVRVREVVREEVAVVPEFFAEI